MTYKNPDLYNLIFSIYPFPMGSRENQIQFHFKTFHKYRDRKARSHISRDHLDQSFATLLLVLPPISSRWPCGLANPAFGQHCRYAHPAGTLMPKPGFFSIIQNQHSGHPLVPSILRTYSAVWQRHSFRDQPHACEHVQGGPY